MEVSQNGSEEASRIIQQHSREGGTETSASRTLSRPHSCLFIPSETLDSNQNVN